ncbi:MAG: MFS transporter [Acidobacteria bacterium]|nr:MFS transporter [Acidobacteriota bacterium]
MSGGPGRLRWRIYWLILMVATLSFIDRFNMNVAVKYIGAEYNLSPVEIGRILGAFGLGYALLQIPGGWLADRLGARLILTLALLWWSLFTALTAFAGPFLWTVRFLVGAGEGPALPSANKLLGRWLAPRERGRGSSVFLLAVGLGGIFTPPAVAWAMTVYGWRPVMVTCGLLGVVVTALWHLLSAEHPGQHPRITPAELQFIAEGRPEPRPATATPWRRLLHPSVFALGAANFMLGYVTYIFYTWFFLYLVNERKMSILAGGYWSVTPFFAILAGAPLGGFVSDFLVRCLGHPWGRRIPVVAAATLSAALLALGSRHTEPYGAILILGLAAGCNSVCAVSSWALPNDISERHGGSVAGFLNTLTNLGGALSPVLTPKLATDYGWVAALDFAALFMVCIAALWLLVDPRRRID